MLELAPVYQLVHHSALLVIASLSLMEKYPLGSLALLADLILEQKRNQDFHSQFTTLDSNQHHIIFAELVTRNNLPVQ